MCLYLPNCVRRGAARRPSLLFVVATFISVPAIAQKPGILVPPGFRVDHYADDDLAHDIHSMTIDSKGRVVVSGPGYVRILIDSNGDGRADSYKQFADGPKSGAQGMYFMGPHLLCSGGEGLLIYRDDNGDDRADGKPATFLKIAAGGEHHVHSVQRGPDGWWYIIAGNMAGVTKDYATLPTSPLKNPEAGVLMRMKPDLSGGEIISDGFRNAYDFAFTEAGDIFTFDSDGERDVSLPWYLPCRVFHVTPRSNAGWVSRSWKRPNDFPDMPPVIAEFGRGSPTGVACYRHVQFPSRYNGALFVLDWTFGRVLAISLEGQRGLWKGTPAIFAKSSGKFGFAPTDIEVGKDGSLFVSVGGRGTRGSVFRIVNTESEGKTAKPVDTDADQNVRLNAVLDAPQPESSWSRAEWYPLARRLGKAAFVSAATDEGRRPIQRVRAIEIMVSTFGGLDPATARILTTARSVPVRARTAWAIGRADPDSPNASATFALMNDREPLVTRFALEALTTVQDRQLLDKCLPRLAVTLGSADAGVRAAAANVVEMLSDDQREQLSLLLDGSIHSQVWMALGTTARNDKVNLKAARIAVAALQDNSAGPDSRIDALRLLQLSLGDVGPQKGVKPALESYTARGDLADLELQLNPVRTILARQFPSGHARYDRELVRTIAILGSLNRDMIGNLLQGITPSSSPPNDIHRLAALSKVQATRTHEQSKATARALVNLEIKIRQQGLKQDTNWDDRVGEILDAICEADPLVPTMIAEQSGFGLPGHVIFLRRIPADNVQQAIDGFVRQINADSDYAWTNDIIFVIGKSTNPAHQLLVRDQIENLSVQDAVLIVLSRNPKPADRSLYLNGLNSPQPSAVQACLQALLKLPRNNDAREQYLLLSTARRLIHSDRELALRESVIRLLQNNLGQSFGFRFGKQGYVPQPEALARWQSHLKKRFPNFEPKIDGGNAALKVLAVLDEVHWEQGNPERGQSLFSKLSCTRCHGGRTALGPDLQGIGKRFSRPDLFAAIVDPNRDVSARYQLTTVETRDGKSYSGLIVYESVDGLILRDSEQNTYRIEADDIETKVKRRVSLMPNGLLKNVGDQDLADLDAYLRRL